MYGGVATPLIVFSVMYYSELRIAITFYWYRSTIAGSYRNNSTNKKSKNNEIMKTKKRKI